MSGLRGAAMTIDPIEKEIKELQEENSRLKMLSEVDGLTGLYNRVAGERIINDKLRKNAGGNFMVIDVDGFKRINDRYGHLFGDDVLRGLAELMRDIFRTENLVGRFGGDEFVVFTTEKWDSRKAMEKGKELIRRMEEMGRKMGVEDRFSATIGMASYQDKDTYSSMFSRADYALLEGKKSGKSTVYLYRERQKELPPPETAENKGAEDTGIDRDMELIWMELREKDRPQGAYCQDYETFKRLYRFVERGLMRAPSSAYTILLTLVDDNKAYVTLQDKEHLMISLGKTIKASLRSGDVYTQYSSCQYLLMVMGTSLENARKVVERVRSNFTGDAQEYSVYIGSNIRPLQSAGRGLSHMEDTSIKSGCSDGRDN